MMDNSEAIVRRMRQIWCCKGAEFARRELQDGWVEIERLRAEDAMHENDIVELHKRIEELEKETLELQVLLNAEYHLNRSLQGECGVKGELLYQRESRIEELEKIGGEGE